MSVEPTTPLTGGCFCGAIQYEVAGPMQPATRCHCSMCRKRYGGVGSAIAPVQDFVWLKGEDRLSRFGEGWVVGFCRRCGSTLAGIQDGKVLAVTVSSLDGDPPVAIQHHIFAASRACWDVIADDVPCFDEWPT